MVFHFVHKQRGAHVEVRVFGSASALLGQLMMLPGEWLAFRAMLIHGAGGDVRPDGSISVHAIGDDEEPPLNG